MRGTSTAGPTGIRCLHGRVWMLNKTTKRPMPTKLRAQARAAVERHQARPITPEVAVIVTPSSWSYSNPYRASDELGWCAMLFEAFGTRQRSVADVFINHLAQLCSTAWDAEARAWRPNQSELQTAIAIVRSMSLPSSTWLLTTKSGHCRRLSNGPTSVSL
jgi:hypothetical protein